MLDRKKIIDDIVLKPSHLSDKWFLKNNKEIYNLILNYTIDLELPFKQRIWHWINNISIYYKCECGKRTTFYKNWKDGYRKYCSSSCAQKSKDTKEKRRQTNINKYGVDNISKLDSIKDKIASTNLKRYGFKSSFQNTEVRNKWKNSIYSKWGVDHYFKTNDFKIKAKSYYLKKHGVHHQSMVDYVKEKIKNTCLDRYGVETYLNTKHSRDSIKSYNRSSYEYEIIEWLKSIGFDVIDSERNIIKPMLLDIYLPKYKIAIEFNGLYWHSEFKKDRNYHLNKTLLCKESGVDLIHIWEDDWLNRKEILKSIILNRTKMISNKVYARKCEIVELDNIETSKFLNENHIQGYCRFNKSYALKYKGEIVSLMSFGYRSINGKKEYELIRFCNKKNTVITGSANKLYKYFLNKNLANVVVSYADISIFKGDVYREMGFVYSHRSDVNYWWVIDGVRKHRFNYNKKKLIKMGFDSTMTEVEIMHSINSYRVYGCGQDKWVWNRF